MFFSSPRYVFRFPDIHLKIAKRSQSGHGVMASEFLTLEVSELLDAVVADVGDDNVPVVGNREPDGPLQLAAVGVDGGVESSSGQDEHLKGQTIF